MTEIGGYFELDLPDNGELYDDVFKFQSARAAMRAVLESENISRVLIPAYICDSIFKSAEEANVAIETYDLDQELFPENLPPDLSSGTVLIYVNYFGLCRKNLSRLLEKVSKDQIIIDNSHALFSQPLGVLAEIYSPRKFVGLPDGGLLRASPSLAFTVPDKEDNESFERMDYLLTRMAYSARQGYSGFDMARKSLDINKPMMMSRLTQRLMRSINWEKVVRKRRENFQLMSDLLGEKNSMAWVLHEDDVPLCYPLTSTFKDVQTIRNQLASMDIFTATYWPDALKRVRAGRIEDTMINQTLFLPIDQRIGVSEVEEVCKVVLSLVNNEFGDTE